MKRKNEKAAPKNALVRRLLNSNETVSADNAVIIRMIKIYKPGWVYLPRIMPRHKGTQIRRKGISLVSTVCSE